MRKTTLLITLMLTLFGARVAFGASFFVNSSIGNDANDCTAPGVGFVCQTIQHALDLSPSATGEGVEVTIAPGIYLETVNISSPENVFLVGDGTGPGDVIIQSPSGAVTMGGLGAFQLSNLTLDGASMAQQVVFVIDAPSVIITDCVIRNGMIGLEAHGSDVTLLNAVTVLNYTNVGIVLRSFSTLRYSSFVPDVSLDVTGPGPAGGIGIHVDLGELAISDAFNIESNFIGILTDNGSTLRLQPGVVSRIAGNEFGAVFVGTHARLGGPGPLQIEDNVQNGILAIDGTTIATGGVTIQRNGNDARPAIAVLQGGSLNLNGVSVINNRGGGVVIRNNSTGRFSGSTITGNAGVGVELAALSSLLLQRPTNIISDVICSKTSEMGGDTSGVVSNGCDKKSK